MNDHARASVRRKLDVAGAIAAVIGIAGFVVKPSLAPLWAFLILFGITTVPERLIRRLRERRRARQPARELDTYQSSPTTMSVTPRSVQ